MTYATAEYGSVDYGGEREPAAATRDALDMPVVAVEVAFGSDPLAASPSWTALAESEVLRRFRINRGRSFELDTFDPGSASVSLRNEDRAFDPDNSAGPYHPNLEPMKRIRVRATWNASTYSLFDGFVDDWGQPDELNPNYAEAEVTATDLFKVLKLIELPSPWQVKTIDTEPRAWWRLGEAAGSAEVADSIAAVTGDVGSGVTLGAAGLVASDDDSAASYTNTAVIDEYIEVDNTFVQAADPFTVAVWAEPAATPASAKSAVSAINSGFTAGWAFTQTTSGSLIFEWIGSLGGFSVGSGALTTGDTVFVAATVETDRVVLYVDGVEVDRAAATGIGDSIAAHSVWFFRNADAGTRGFEGTLDEVVFWNRALSASEVAGLFEAGRSTVSGAWGGDTTGERLGRILDVAGAPTSQRNLDAGQTVMQGTANTVDALSSSFDAAEAEGAGLWFIGKDGRPRFIDRAAIVAEPYLSPAASFSDTGDGLAYHELARSRPDQRIRNDVRVQRRFGALQVATDPTSITAYGRRVLPKTDLLIAGTGEGGGGDEEARDLAGFLLALFKDPETRLSRFAINPRHDPDNLFPVVLAMELGDRINVKYHPQGQGAQLQWDLTIQAIDHRVTTDSWLTVLRLSPALGATY